MDIEININDIEFVTDLGKICYVFWRDIFVGSIEQVKKTKYTPPELAGKWECGYTSNEYYETKELAAIGKVKKYLTQHPDRINGPKESDLESTKNFKQGIYRLKRIRLGDYGPDNNILKQEFEEWCIKNNIGDETFRSRIVQSFMSLILSSNTWHINQENLPYCQYIKNVIRNVLKYLLLQGISIRTFRQHSNNLSILGEDILQKSKSFNFNQTDFKDLFLQGIQESSKYPPDYGYVDKEGWQKKFRSTCKRLTLFLQKN